MYVRKETNAINKNIIQSTIPSTGYCQNTIFVLLVIFAYAKWQMIQDHPIGHQTTMKKVSIIMKIYETLK